MKTHQGYKTQREKGAECSKCEEWIEPGEEAALIEPGKILKSGSIQTTAEAIHGVLHKSCLEEL